MNLLYTLTTYPPAVGGAQLHQHLLAQQLQLEHNIQVVSFWDRNRTDWLLGTTLNAPDHAVNYSIDNIRVHRMGLSRCEKLRLLPWLLLYYPWMAAALPPMARIISAQLRSFAGIADLIHNVRIGREGLTYASLQSARQRGMPFVLTPVHHPRWVGWRYEAYNRLYRQADALIALTPSEKQTLVDLGVESGRIHITGIGPVLAPQADAASFRQRYDIAGPIVLFLGQHYKYKGFQAVLAAATLVWQQHPETFFVFVGPPVGQSEQVFAAVPDRRICRLGTVSLQEKTDALAACDLLCVPSLQESFGGIYTEAWSFGKPVIGGQIAAIADVVTDGQDGFLVEQQPAEIAERISYLLSHPAQAAAMGAAGRAKVEAYYSWPQLAQKTLQVYQQVCR
jgi:glycosyltransferase involved in cell wall biosynthesis